AVAISVAMFLAGCAGSVSAPKPILSLSLEQRAALRLSAVSADAAEGVQMTAADFDLICQKVKAHIQEASPGVLGDPAGGKAGELKLHFTRFDRGNAFARAMLA